jgi:sodium transport system permease protein
MSGRFRRTQRAPLSGVQAWWAVVLHELRLQLRQPMVLGISVFMALLTGPLGMNLMDAWMSTSESAAGSASKGRPLRIAADDPIPSWITEDDLLEVSTGRVTTDDVLESDEVYGHARLEGTVLTFERPLSVTKAGKAQDRLEDVWWRHVREQYRAELDRVGVDPDAFAIEVVPVERNAADREGDQVGRMLPGLLVFLLMAVSLYGALGAITGEKENDTAEALRVTPISPRVLLLGKATIVYGLTVSAGAIWAGSLFAAQSAGWLELPKLLGESQVFTLSNTVVLLGMVLLLGAQLTALSMAVAAWAPNMRQAGVASTPLMILVLAPTGLAAAPGVDLSPGLAFVPIANVTLGARAWLAGDLPLGLASLLLVATALHTGLALAGAIWWMLRNDPLDKGLDAESRRAVGNYAPDAFTLFAVVFVAYWFFGQLAQANELLFGLAFSQVGVLLPLAVGGVWFFGAPIRRTLSLVLPSGRNLALGVVAGLAMPGLGQLVQWGVSFFAVVDSRVVEGLVQLQEYPIWATVFVGAVLPGVCEEMLFRGSLFGLLRTRVGVGVALAVTSVMFGFLHADLVRIVLTGILGLVLGWALVRSGTLWVPVVMHALNNALSFSMLYIDTESFPGADSPVYLGVSALLTVVCLGCVWAMAPRATPAGDGRPA